MKTSSDKNKKTMDRPSTVALLTVAGLIMGWSVFSIGQLALTSIVAPAEGAGGRTDALTDAPATGAKNAGANGATNAGDLHLPGSRNRKAEEEGDAFARAGQCERAIECYDRSIYGASWLLMPISEWFVRGNEPQNVENRKSIEADSYAARHAKRGGMHVALGHYQEALNDYEKANELNGGEVEVERIARVLCLLGSYDRAIAAYSSAIAKTPSQADLYLKRSVLYRKLDKIRLAAEDRKNALVAVNEKIAKDDSDVNYFWRARLNLAMKNLDAALGDIDKAIEISPSSTDRSPYYAKRAEIELALGKTESAVDDIKRSERNQRPWSLITRAKVLLAEGKLPEAIADLDAAIAEKYDHAAAHYLRGQACTRLGLREQAEKELNLARTLGYWSDPTVPLGI